MLGAASLICARLAVSAERRAAPGRRGRGRGALNAEGANKGEGRTGSRGG